MLEILIPALTSVAESAALPSVIAFGASEVIGRSKLKSNGVFELVANVALEVLCKLTNKRIVDATEPEPAPAKPAPVALATPVAKPTARRTATRKKVVK